MRTVETTAVVTAEHTVTVQLPADFPTGLCTVAIAARGESVGDELPLGLSKIETGPWPDGFTVSREQIYDDLKIPIIWAEWPGHDAKLNDPTCTFRREDIYGDDGR